MNRIFSLVTVSCVLAFTTQSQTNIFPDIGNVGVGTTAPRLLLDVNGNAIIQGILLTGGEVIELNSANTGNRYAYLDFHGDDTYSDYGLRMIRHNSGANTVSEIIHRGIGQFRMKTVEAGDIRFATAGTDKVTIRSNGYFGIGTTNPQSMLEIYKELPPLQNALVDWVRLSARHSSNFDKLDIFAHRASDTPGWENTELFIQRSVDNSSMGFVKFGAWNVSLGVKSSITLMVTENNVGIGTVSPSHKLTVNGPIRAKEIIVDTGWADDVFSPDYNLTSLKEVQAHIEQERRLPGMPSAKEVAENGISLGETQSLLLRKIEELTLHVIRLEEKNKQLEQRLEGIEATASK